VKTFITKVMHPMSRYDRPSRTVHMTFFFRSGWQVYFLEADYKRHFQDVHLCGLREDPKRRGTTE
jgi:hypothetical protein